MTWIGKTNFKTGEAMVVDIDTGAIIAHVRPAETMDTTARRTHTIAASEAMRQSLTDLLASMEDVPRISDTLQNSDDRFAVAIASCRQSLAAAERTGP